MHKAVGPFAIDSAQRNILVIDKYGIHTTVSIDPTTLAPCNEPSINASQILPDEEKRPTERDTNRHDTQTALTEYTFDRIVSHEGSGAYVC